ncbi:MAG: NAD(+)/NADH kinase [Lachnospiraceae bacterium]|nr:NAD(+)/NADH kinase [Lachnospiraceae bacterium]
MKNYLIITNDKKDPQYKLTNEIKGYIESKGGKADVAAKSMDAFGGSIIPTDRDIDCVLVLGGDGTMLRAAKDIVDRQIPMLGINLGTLGFLADVDKDRYKEAIDSLFEDRFFLQERMTVEATISYSDKSTKTLPAALNDIVVSKRGSSHVIRVEIYVNGQYLYAIDADGIIAATPTGSTGYSMSAGGPIIHPNASLISITPICAHTMNIRTIVVGPDDVVEFVIGQGRDDDTVHAEVFSDGGAGYGVSTGDRIKITRAGYSIRLVKTERTSFLQTLNRKMAD